MSEALPGDSIAQRENGETKMKSKKRIQLPSLRDILLAIFGAVLCGIGSGFTKYASCGMDAIGIFYDGIRNILKLAPDQIGTASYVVCIILSVFLWFADRRYVSFGSIIYIIVYGVFANLGTMLWEWIRPGEGRLISLMIAVFGLLILYVGLSVYITIDIGVDAFTGVMLWLCDITHKELKYVKIMSDLLLALIGYLLGGTLGIITPIAIIIGGPCISFLNKRFAKIYFGKEISRP